MSIDVLDLEKKTRNEFRATLAMHQHSCKVLTTIGWSYVSQCVCAAENVARQVSVKVLHSIGASLGCKDMVSLFWTGSKPNSLCLTLIFNSPIPFEFSELKFLQQLNRTEYHKYSN